MALPAILGIPALVSWLSGVFAAIAAWLIARFGEQLALRLAIVAMILASIGLAVAAIKALLVGIVPAVPSIVATALVTAFPTNTDELIGVYLGIEAVTIALARANLSYLR